MLMSLLIFQNARKQSQTKAEPPKKEGEEGQEGQEGQEGAEGGEGGEGGENNPPASTGVDREAVAQTLVNTFGMTEDAAKALVADYGSIVDERIKAEEAAQPIAKMLTEKRYAVAMKSATDGTYLVSINSTKSKAEEVYAQVQKYVESKSADDAEEIFNISEDEIEGTEFETIGDNTYVKGSGHFVINPTNVLEVEV